MNGQKAKPQTAHTAGYYSTAGGSAVAIRFEPAGFEPAGFEPAGFEPARFEPAPAAAPVPVRARIEIAGPDEDPNLEPAAYASPPCFMHELDPAWLGYMRREELRDFLLRLHEGWKSGMAMPAGAAGGMDDGEIAAALKTICREDIAIRDRLRRHVERLGGAADPAGPAPEGGAGPAALLRTRDALVAEVRALLPRIDDDSVRRDLAELVTAHERRAALTAVL